MQKVLQPHERLIVAADFKPTDYNRSEQVAASVFTLANSLQGTGVYLKVNSALRADGYRMVREIRLRQLQVFADLKLYDIGETLSTDGALLAEVKPELLTVVCSAGVRALRALKQMLPETEILGVTILTSLTDEDTQHLYGVSVPDAVLRSAEIAEEAGIDGLIAAPKEIAMLRNRFGNRFSINTPAIRPLWSRVAQDDQNPTRVMTPADAIKAGADRIVVGRPIVQPPDNLSSYDAAMRTIDEIASAM